MPLITAAGPDVVFKLGQFDIASCTQNMLIYLVISYYPPIAKK